MKRCDTRTTRKMFGATLADLQITQAKLGDMAMAVDASALLVYRAAWTRDVQRRRITREAAMAKLHATEMAQTGHRRRGADFRRARRDQRRQGRGTVS